ncbi:MAG: hypothetical protein R3F25_10020 [Gammaproteobacteria bacterium]
MGLMVLFPLISPIQLLPADSPKKAMPDAKLPPSETPSLKVPIKFPTIEFECGFVKLRRITRWKITSIKQNTIHLHNVPEIKFP